VNVGPARDAVYVSESRTGQQERETNIVVWRVGGLEEAWAEKWSSRMSSETKDTRSQPLLLAFPRPQKN
jgi:hypothetical protein